MSIQVRKLQILAPGFADDSEIVGQDKTTSKQKALLKDIHCQFHMGEITLLLGKTGAGKSTLLDSLAGLRKPSSGKILVDGQPLWLGKRLNPQVQRQITLSFQAPEDQLFARTVYKEFAYSLQSLKLSRQDMLSTGRNLLNSFGLPEEVLYQSPLYLSQGQKRRVALATTFAGEPRWMLLDEPTAGLDDEAASQFVRLLQDLLPRIAGGFIVATHDLDTFLPIAHRVVLLQQGRILAIRTPKQLLKEPELFQSIDIGAPSAAALTEELNGRGCPIGLSSYDAGSAAQEILQWIGKNTEAAAGSPPNPLNPPDLSNSPAPSNPVKTVIDKPAFTQAPQTADAPCMAKAEPDKTGLDKAGPSYKTGSSVSNRTLWLTRLDPRAKWLTYILTSLGILLQSGKWGYALASALTLAILWTSRIRIGNLLRLVSPFLLLMFLSSALSGLQFGQGAPAMHLWIHTILWKSSLMTFLRFYRFLLIIVLGLILAATTSQLRMKQGLEQSLRIVSFKWFKAPAEAFALATSLILRFIPVILRELRRFTRIAQARGRSAKSGGVRWRDLPQVVIPLVLSVIRIGDDLSTAMEARGYRRIGQPRSASAHLKFAVQDWYAAAFGLTVLLLLWFI